MNIHNSRKIKKKTLLEVYPLGVIRAPYNFCDIVNEKGDHICCVISIPSLEELEEKRFVINKGEFIFWDTEGFPDIYVNNKKITFSAMKKGLKLLEKDTKNKFIYKLIKKNFFDL